MKISNKSRFRKARERTGLSKGAVKSIIRKLGIKDFDSKKELRRVVRYAKEQNSGGGSNANNSDSSNSSNGSDNNQVPETSQIQDNYNELLQKYEDQQSSYSNLESEVGSLRDQIGTYDDEIAGYRSTIGNLESKIGDYDSQISDFRTRVSTLSDQYSGALKDNETLTTERDKAREQFAEQSAAYQAAMQERDMYREMNVNQQLRSLRGGATAGGANQTSFRSGSLATGRTGYDSGSRNRDLAERVAQEGMTDSVLARETPVVELIDRRRQGSGKAPGQVRAMTTSGGSGSYYASRFGG